MSESFTNNSSTSYVNPDVVECDSQLAALQAQICRLKTTRNQFMPVSRLPTELLSKIFLCVRDTHIESRIGPSWVNSTCHVSHHWRTVAINCPKLWSQLFLNRSPEWLELQLQRVKKSPLSVVGHSCWGGHGSGKVMPVLAWTQQYPGQLRSFLMTNTPTTIIKMYMNNFRGVHAPFLESLVCSTLYWCDSYRNPDGRDRNVDSEHIPPDLFSEGTPSLREVCLQGVVLPFSSPIFNGLSSLSLATCYTPTITLAGFFDALARCPNLESLDVVFKFSQCLSYDTPPHAAQISLSKVKTFTLLGTMSNCTTILEHLVLPISAKLKIAIVSDAAVAGNDQSTIVVTQHKKLCGAIQQAWLSNTSSIPQTDNYHDDSDSSSGAVLPPSPDAIRRVDYEEDLMHHDTTRNSNPKFSLVFYLGCPSGVVDPAKNTAGTLHIGPESGGSTLFAHHLLHELPVQNVKLAVFADCRLSTPMSLKVWSVVGKLPLLKHLRLKNGSAKVFFEHVLADPALIMKAKDSNTQAEAHVNGDCDGTTDLNTNAANASVNTNTNTSTSTQAMSSTARLSHFRQVTRITFENADFGLAGYGYYFNRVDSDILPVGFDQHLMQFLQLRKQCGAAIKNVAFNGCYNFDDKSLKEVERVLDAKRVEWDGVVKRRGDKDYMLECDGCGEQEEDCRCG